MAKKHKFYVVWKGRKTGVFTTWDDCKAQVEGFAGAEYKSFEDRHRAEVAAEGTYVEHVSARPQEPKPLSEDHLRRAGRPIAESYAVDAACSGNPGLLEYRCVYVATGVEVFKQGPYPQGTNNIGEFLAIVHALALFKRKKITAPIYSDSEIAIGWVESRKCRTKLERSEDSTELFRLIERAETWLLENDYDNRVLKWWTRAWGEIPADFGRK